MLGAEAGALFFQPTLLMRARDNPFANDRLHQIRYRFRGSSWEEFLAQLAKADFRGAIVGPEGSGKTTLLEDLEPKLKELDLTPMRLRLSYEAPRFSPVMQQMIDSRITPRHILLFDGAEHLGWFAWKRFLLRVRPAGGLIITRQRAGRLPTVMETRTSTELLAEIVTELMEDGPQLDPDQIRHIYRKHRGNMRDALRDLYDRFALGRANTLVVKAGFPET